MCILFFIVNENPEPGEYKLILASNRDEFYARKAQSAATWMEDQYVIGGRDLECGRELGAWLAISAKPKEHIFKIGVLLNITGEPKTDECVLGRGYIVSDYVLSDNTTNWNYCKNILRSSKKYASFNFVTIELRDNQTTILNCSNAPNSISQWASGTSLAFGNSPPDTPLEKVKCGKIKFEEIIETKKSTSILVEQLMDLLKCEDKFWPDTELEKRAPDRGEKLSSIFVKIPDEGYGSRTHTVIVIDWENRMDFYEETLEGGFWMKTHLTKNVNDP